MGSLKNKNAIVTGTSQGIGAAIALHLIQAGCNIGMHYYHQKDEPEKMKKLAEANGQKAVCIQADLTKESNVNQCIRELTQELGTIDILVNNTGSLVERRYLNELDKAYWDKLIDINMTSMMMVTRELYSHFNTQRGSSIINVASLAGRKGGHLGSLVYSTTKGAVITWSRSLSTELAPSGIRVNAVAPGFIEGTRFHNTHTTPESAKQTIDGIPLGRSGCPDDVARAVTFLASEYDGFITGITMDINGGVYAA
ncbi:3-oxoacyl-[acyl-carrier protein] reductase [Catalinimonas alkaloidigena]|uniref:SDR family NAD(P)-dependent oxidoreductase n=1 Tax=Catalinimonas alkaloidigena TaxID=1075417 RepID=UPI0024058835|nr:glucose 1-dehydrogenase [Catalinimonas alkaloidigena]MDF9797889.1 3-oxoacyl-[acyl-carrier protein] reductase [Catalinimonas alkaloidigena]